MECLLFPPITNRLDVPKMGQWSGNPANETKAQKRRSVTVYFASWYTCVAIHHFASTKVSTFGWTPPGMVSKGRMFWFRLWCNSRFRQLGTWFQHHHPKDLENTEITAELSCAISMAGSFGRVGVSVVNLEMENTPSARVATWHIVKPKTMKSGISCSGIEETVPATEKIPSKTKTKLLH